MLKSRIGSVLAGLDKVPAMHESPVRFQAGHAGDLQDLDGLRELLASSHRLEDETEALVAGGNGDSAAYTGLRGGHLRMAQLNTEALCFFGHIERDDCAAVN